MESLIRFFTAIWNNLGSIVVSLLVVAFLIAMAFAFSSPPFIAKLADQDFARGLITFIIAVSTIILGFIIVTNALFGNADQEAENRFRRGREVFAGLLGVLGTIVGFYFGAFQQSSRELQLAPIEFVDAGGTQQLVTFVNGGVPPYRYTIRFGDKSGPVIENKISDLGWIKENIPPNAGNRIVVDVADRANRQATISREKETLPKAPDKK